MAIENWPFEVPTWAMPALMMGDYTGLSDEDEEAVRDFTRRVEAHVEEWAREHGRKCHWHFALGDNEEPFLTSDHAMGRKLANCDTVYVVVMPDTWRGLC